MQICPCSLTELHQDQTITIACLLIFIDEQAFKQLLTHDQTTQQFHVATKALGKCASLPNCPWGILTNF